MVTVKFNLTDELAARLAVAYGRALNLFDNSDPENPVPRDATMAEFKAKLGNMALQVLHDQERKVLVDAVVVPPAEIT
jgi:hypothetical protein